MKVLDRERARPGPALIVIYGRRRAYGVFGGTPYYLSLCAPERPLAENRRALILQDGAPLRDEPDHLLQAELQNVARYASMLRAVADGCTRRPEITSRALSKGEEATSRRVGSPRT